MVSVILICMLLFKSVFQVIHYLLFFLGLRSHRVPKIENYLWGCFRIQDELKKLAINVSRETIRKIIADYRKSGEIKSNLSWKRFLTAQWESLFACDFFTVDLFGFKQFYVLFGASGFIGGAMPFCS